MSSKNQCEEENFASKEYSFIIYLYLAKKIHVKIGTKKKENMKYAIAQTSGKQFFLKPGQWYDVDLIKNVNLGDFIYMNKVLFFRNKNNVQVGKPFLGKSQIPAKIIQQVKGEKLIVLKTKPKKKYTRTRGHRQPYTRVQIDTIQ